MVIERIGLVLPCSRGQAFDLAADIEHYPDFLRGWISARIQKREANTCYVEQVLGFGPVRLQFASKTLLQRPERIDVISTDPLFQQFRLTWSFETALPGAGCRVSLAAALELRSRMLQRIVDRVLPTTIDDVIAAFEARAGRLFVLPGSTAGPTAPRS